MHQLKIAYTPSLAINENTNDASAKNVLGVDIEKKSPGNTKMQQMAYPSSWNNANNAWAKNVPGWHWKKSRGPLP